MEQNASSPPPPPLPLTVELHLHTRTQAAAAEEKRRARAQADEERRANDERVTALRADNHDLTEKVRACVCGRVCGGCTQFVASILNSRPRGQCMILFRSLSVFFNSFVGLRFI